MPEITNLSQENLLESARSYLELNQPFVIYTKPNSNQLIGFFQKDTELYFVDDFNENGFAFAPFDGVKIVILPLNKSQIFSATKDRHKFKECNRSIFQSNRREEHTDFINLVTKGINEIKKSDLKKVVLSRRETLSIKNPDPIALFQKLLNQNTTTFTYCFYHPKVGLWLGAFSERLMLLNGVNFQTMSVAGTQLFEERKEIIWQNKEIEEQKFVTDFIISNIQNKVSNIVVSKPFSLLSGTVVHIKTELSGVLNTNSNLKELLYALHPTPAVCGFPKQKSKAFILENENYNREYYSGYFGELNINFDGNEKTTDFYVNLRCMQIKDGLALLYIGCGITKDSIPEKEWQETVNKSNTMKQILDLKQ